MTRDNITRPQVESADLARGNVDIIGSGKIIVIGRAQKTKTIG